MQTVRLIFMIWASIVGLGTWIGYIRIAPGLRLQGSRLSASINVAYFAATFTAASGLIPPPIPGWWTLGPAPLGIFIVILAQALAYWSGRELGSNFSTELAPVRDGTLVTSGPFRICRHPIMLSYLMTWTGTMIALCSWTVLVAFGFVSILIVKRIALEEEALSERFRETYAQYRGEVSLIVPFLDPKSKEAQEIENAVQLLK